MAQRVREKSSDGAKDTSSVGPQSDFSVANRLLPGPNQLHPHGAKRKVTWRHCPPTEQILASASLSAPPPHYCVISTLPPAAPLPFTNGSTAATHLACTSDATVPTNNHRTISPKSLGSKPLNAGDGCSTNGHDGEEEEEDSGEDSDGESSVKSHSSHGGGSSVEEPKRPRRTRIAYSNYQLDQLELVFIRTQYPDVYLREEMADRLGIKEDRIQVWFQNRRARFRKQERTGCVSYRSRYRRRRLQEATHDSNGIPTPMLSGYSHVPTFPLMLASPYTYPPDAPPATSNSLDSLPPNPPPPTSSSLPGFHTLHPRLPPQFHRLTGPASSSLPGFYALHSQPPPQFHRLPGPNGAS